MWNSRTKLLRGVVAFLAACALLGLFLGIKGSLPRAGAYRPSEAGSPLAETTTAPVVEAIPLDTDPGPPPEPEKKPAEKAKEPEKKPEPVIEKTEPAPTPAPATEVAPTADPVGDLLAQPAPPPETPY